MKTKNVLCKLMIVHVSLWGSSVLQASPIAGSGEILLKFSASATVPIADVGVTQANLNAKGVAEKTTQTMLELKLPKFDPIWGELQSMEVEFYPQVTNSFRAEVNAKSARFLPGMTATTSLKCSLRIPGPIPDGDFIQPIFDVDSPRSPEFPFQPPYIYQSPVLNLNPSSAFISVPQMAPLEDFVGVGLFEINGLAEQTARVVVGRFKKLRGKTSHNFSLDIENGIAQIQASVCYRLEAATAGLLDGDVNLDDFVGVEDLDIILANWGDMVTSWNEGDLNCDGVVGVADLNIVIANWGNTP